MYYGGKRRQVLEGDGFTFVEVMITLAISAAMLVITAVSFGGQQHRTQFTQGMRDLESKIQDVMNDVSTGYYPSSTASCTPNYASGPTFNTAATIEQGSNLDCMYVGKAIHFQEDKMMIYTLVGNRLSASGSKIQSASFALSRPVVATHLTESRDYLWGLTVKDMRTNAATTSSALIVFASTTNATGSPPSNTSVFNSGIQRISPLISGIPASTAIQTSSAESDVTPTLLRNLTSWAPGNRLTICFENAPSGAARLVGGIIIEGGARTMSARLQLETDSDRCT